MITGNNLKKLTLSIIIYSALVLAIQSTYATTATSSSENQQEEKQEEKSDNSEKIKKIEELKEKIATKVAELRDKEKGAILGTITKMDKSSITLLSRDGERKIIYSDDTLYFTVSGGNKKESKSINIKEKDLISVFGYYDQDSKVLSAKYIYNQDLPIHLIGKIADIDKGNFTITVKSKQEEIIVDYEKYTKTSSYSKQSKKWVSSGFSKLKLGDTVHIIGDPHKSEDNRIYARKIYTLSFLNQPSPTTTEQEIEEISPSQTETSE